MTDMEDDHPALVEINRHLSHWLRRLRLQRAAAWAIRGWSLALVACLLVGLLALPGGRLLESEFFRLAAGLSLAGSLGGATAGLAWPLPRLAAARRFDRLFGLRERVSTALELAALPAGDPHSPPAALRFQQLEDALHSARRVDLRRSLPLRFRRAEVLLLAALLLASTLTFFAARPFFQAAQARRQVQQAIAAQEQQVEALLEQIRQDPALAEPDRQAAAQAIDRLQQQLQSAETPEQAVSMITAASDQLRSLEGSRQEALSQALQDAGQALSQLASPSLQEAGQALAQGDPQAAGQALNHLDPASLTPAERQALAEQLRAAAQASAASSPATASKLEAAAQALESGDAAAARQALQQAAQAMSQSGALGQAATALNQSSQQLAQGSGSQPGNGQASQGNTGQGNGQSGAGAGSSTQPGSGAGAGGAGRGESQGSAASGPAAGTSPIQGNNGPGDGGERPYESVYAPERLGGQGGPDVGLPSSGQPGGQGIGQGGVTPGNEGAGTVPWTEVFPAYQEAYRQAVENGQVPVALRSIIREYFSSLQP